MQPKYVAEQGVKVLEPEEPVKVEVEPTSMPYEIEMSIPHTLDEYIAQPKKPCPRCGKFHGVHT